MSTLFNVGTGNNYLTINSAAGGANVVAPNPDTTQTTIFLTTSQVRQLGIAASFHIATDFVNSTIAGITIETALNKTSFPDSDQPPVKGVNITVPLGGSGTGQNFVIYLTRAQCEELFNVLCLYSVSNQ